MGYADDDVQRFVQAQGGGVYEEALAELRDGYKLGHWMWFVFPQVRGLGFSPMADYFGIGSWEEAEAYMADEVLAPRLIEAAEALLGLEGSDPVAVLGSIDALKLCSSMTLFEQVSDNPAFPAVLDRYYQGERDPMTLEIAESFPSHNVLFLDFDGVMQSDYERSHKLARDEFSGLRDRLARRFDDDAFLALGNDDLAAALYDWTPEAIESVRRIVEEGNARIVISSSWRFYDDDSNLCCLLKLHGLDSYFEGALSRDLTQEREDAIVEYAAAHPCSVGGYVAVDDAKLKGLAGHYVHVLGGSLSRKDADEALKLLCAE